MSIPSFCKQSQADLDNIVALARGQGRKLAVEVIADNSGKFCGNGLEFDMLEKALEYGSDLSGRWMAVREFRVVAKKD